MHITLRESLGTVWLSNLLLGAFLLRRTLGSWPLWLLIDASWSFVPRILLHNYSATHCRATITSSHLQLLALWA